MKNYINVSFTLQNQIFRSFIILRVKSDVEAFLLEDFSEILGALLVCFQVLIKHLNEVALVTSSESLNVSEVLLDDSLDDLNLITVPSFFVF